MDSIDKELLKIIKELLIRKGAEIEELKSKYRRAENDSTKSEMVADCSFTECNLIETKVIK